MIRTGYRPARHILVPPGNVVVRESTDLLAIEIPELARAMRYILNNADRPFSVRDVLKEVPISRRYMECRFRKLFGRTPLQQIHLAHIERAKTLLEDRDLTITEIAVLSGLRDNPTFFRLFKRLMKCTPGQYRKRILQR